MNCPELSRHQRAVLLFSGGKESVMLAHMLEVHRDKIELVWVNTGAMLPHMEEFIRSYGERWSLVELHSDQPARLRTVGLPSRIVPIYNTPLGTTMEREPKGRAMITDWVSCCAALRGHPVFEYMRANDRTLLYHGQRRGDNTFGNTSFPGAEVIAPLWDYSTEQVMRYVRHHGLPLPKQYPAVLDSLECWNCTAELGADRVAWLKENYPERIPELRAMVGTVSEAVSAAIRRETPGIAEMMADKSVV